MEALTRGGAAFRTVAAFVAAAAATGSATAGVAMEVAGAIEVDDTARAALAANSGAADEVCEGASAEECEAAALQLRQLRGVRRHAHEAFEVLGPHGGPGPSQSGFQHFSKGEQLSGKKANSTKSTYKPWSADLNQPSSAPLHEFYMYRAMSDEKYDPINVNAANLPGVLWYLHHEVVVQYPRKFQIKNIERFKVQMKATQPLFDKGMEFGPRMAMDRGQCTGPFVCGRNEGLGPEPKFCEGAFDKSMEADILPPSGKPYGMQYEYGRYGFNVGCNNLGEYPFPMYNVSYPGAIWYTLPGPCPSKTFDSSDATCEAAEPGGLCEGEPTGAGDCTWSYEPMGTVSIDDLVDVPVDELHKKGGREYDPFTNKGIQTNFWDDINDPVKNTKRIEALRKLFATKYPNQTLEEDIPSPKCDFNFGMFYKEFWSRDPFSGECQDAKAGDECYEKVMWAKTKGIYDPQAKAENWYPGLDASSSVKEFQQVLYMQGKEECPHRPCGIGAANATMSKEEVKA